MILSSELIAIGILIKPHGIKGEINMQFDRDVDVSTLRCIVLNIDGIYVPFFVDSLRPRSSESILITISGVDSDVKAQELCGKDVFALRSDIQSNYSKENSEEGFYLSDLIGYTLIDEEDNKVGIVDAYDDSTENWLLIVKKANSLIYVPVADEFILDVDNEKQIIYMNLPDGLMDLN